MTRTIACIALAILMGGCSPSMPPSDAPITELAGRTAGAAQRCVPNEPGRSLRIVDERTLLYGSGETVWLNRPISECVGADRMDTLVIEPSGSQYCRGDRVRVIDSAGGIPGPICALGDFVPYRR